MKSIYKYTYVFSALLLAGLISGCDDKVVGVEGFCPLVQSTSPINLATSVNFNSIITVTFQEKINPATMTPEAFNLSSGTPKASTNKSKALSLAGTMTYDDASNTMSFTPDAPLSSNTVYSGTIKNTIEDPLGNKMLQDYVWSFSTGNAPFIVSTDPADQEQDVALNKIIAASFSQAMDALSIDETTFTLFNGALQINGSVSYNSNDSTASFDPDADLLYGTTYTATITTGAEGENANAIDNDYVWTFTTLNAPIPTVVSTDPADQEQDVALNKIVAASFSQIMDALSIDETTFTLFDGALQINGSVSYNSNDSTASFDPDADLSPGITYTATITTGAEDQNGTALENDYVWSFTTLNAPIPTVVSTDPADQEQDVELNKIVAATFSQIMDALSIDQTTFTLFDGAIQINGSVSYNSNDSTASFDPDADLSPGTTYTATITTGAEDENGTALENDYVWSFTTLPQVQSILGTAKTYGIMATSAITNTGNSVINGDVSLEPGTSMTGFPPGIVNGTININNTQSAQARADLLEAYNYYKNLPPGTTISAGADLGALYPNGIAPGTYTSGSTMLVSTPLVLDAGGDPNAVWVFQIGSSLTTAADITLANGASEKNVFWVPTEDATIGVATTFHGTIVSGRDVTANTGAVINGRILAGAITAGTIALDANTVNVPGFQP